MIKHQQTGFTWISTLIVLAILGGLFIEGASLWKASRIQAAKRVLFHDLARALAFARTEAFLRGEALALSPSNTGNNWAAGIKLQSENNSLSQAHTWQWHVPHSIQLTWHGFRGRDKLVVSHASESLAMNGYFVLEMPAETPEKWVVNRFGRMRVLRKHVA